MNKGIKYRAVRIVKTGQYYGINGSNKIVDVCISPRSELSYAAYMSMFPHIENGVPLQGGSGVITGLNVKGARTLPKEIQPTTRTIPIVIHPTTGTLHTIEKPATRSAQTVNKATTKTEANNNYLFVEVKPVISKKNRSPFRFKISFPVFHEKEPNKSVITIDRISRICAERYKNEDRREIVIVLARYTINAVKEMIRENYDFWHYHSDKNVDFFWLGYYLDEYTGRNISPVRFFADDENGYIGFDTKQYVKEVKKLSEINDSKFGDSIGYLICDYYDGVIHFDDGEFVSISNATDNEIRDITECLISACSREKEAKNVADVVRAKIVSLNIKKKSGSIIGAALSVGSLLK